MPPPLLYLGGVIVGVALHALTRPLPLELELWLRIAVAVAVAAPGLALMGGAIGLFRRTGQDPKPWATTPEIIRTGVYRFTRNPMYVSMALLQIAVGVGLANGWVIALAPFVLAAVYALAVRPEEAYLERKFGDEYTTYKSSVRRWL